MHLQLPKYFFFLIGAVAITLHAKFRIPLKLPGHHGVIFMFLILVGRNLSRFKFASSISALGIAGMLFIPFLGFSDPFMTAVVILPCVCIDVCYHLFSQSISKLWFWALVAGVAYSLIPIMRLIITFFTGFPNHSLFGGFAYPFFSHFVFGLIGGFLGAGIVFALRKK